MIAAKKHKIHKKISLSFLFIFVADKFSCHLLNL